MELVTLQHQWAEGSWEKCPTINQRRTMGRWEMSGKFKAALVNGLGCFGSRRAKTVIH